MPSNSSRPLLRYLSGAALGFLVLAAAGCDDQYPTGLAYPPRTDLMVISRPSDEPPFPDPPGELDRMIAAIKAKGGETLDPRAVPADKRKEINDALTKLYGTPSHPTVPENDDTQEAIAALRLDPKTLARGSQLYRRNCLHCHGLAGDGRGPSGAWLNPHPRDYRQGLFKFMSSTGGESRKPRRADIHRLLLNGIEGTSMPAFNALEVGEHSTDIDPLEALVSYVMHLSLRGEVEFNTLLTILHQEELKDESGGDGGTVASHVEYRTKYYLAQWKSASAEDGQIKPGVTPKYNDEQFRASVARGHKLFTDTEGAASCIKCHADFGRQVNFRYDSWGTLVRPANLTTGVYRGGRRPIDLFWRIKGGIVPSGMPAAAGLSDEQIWDVVNFVQSLPYPRMLPPEIRGRIYVQDREEQTAARSRPLAAALSGFMQVQE